MIHFRALQGHSGRNLIDPCGFFKHIYHIGCGFNLHSIINSGLILGGQNSSKRQTAFFLPVDPRDKSHKDPDEIDLNVPRHAQYLHNAWKRHQDAVYWVDIDLAIQKGLTFYQTRSNAIILQETLPAYCIPKVVRLKTGQVLHEKVSISPRLPPKISLKHEWTRELGSKVARQPEGEVARQPEGEVGRQAKSFQSSQPNPNPDHDRTGKPVVCPQRGALHSQETETRSFREEAVRYDRTVKLVVRRDENHERPTVVCSEQAFHPRFSREGQNLIFGDETNHDRTEKLVVCRDANHERSMLNEVDIDFRIPGLPYSVVKQSENSRVRELVKKIENHPHRQALQHDLQQNNAYNPLSAKSEQMIKDMGNVELFELCETIPKVQCKECLLYWSQGIVYCSCGQLLKESEAINVHWTFTRFKIMSLRRGRHHGHRYGKTTEQRDYHIAHNLRKRCIKRHVHGIFDRFVDDPDFRASQLEHDRTEEVCIKMDELEQKSFRHHMTQAEYFRYKRNWWISLNNDRTSGRLKNRSDFNEALSTLNSANC